MPLTAGTIMDQVAVLLNDPSKVTYTYLKQIPFLKMSHQKVQNRLILLGHPAVAEISAVGLVLAGQTEVTTVDGLPSPEILVEPVRVFERTPGGNDDSWFPMDPVQWEDLREERENLETWAWRKGYIKFTAATTNREVKIFYRKVLSAIVDDTSIIEHPTYKSFLEFYTAGLISEFVLKDKTRAQSLYLLAEESKEDAIQTSVKTMQRFPVKRRPYFFRR